MKIKVSIDRPLPSDGGNLTHVSTSWQVSRVPDFSLSEYLIAQSLEDDINLLEYRPNIDIVDNVSVYARIKYHFSDGNASNWSKIIPINSNQRGIKMSGTVVVTPKVAVEFKYNGLNFSNLKLSTSDYKLYSGAGDHKSTDWYIVDIDGKVLWSRLGDEKYLTEIIVDSSYLRPNEIYIIKAVHNSTVNTSSIAGKAILNTNISKDNLFKLEMIDKLVPERDIYFKLWVYTRLHETTDIIIKDNNGITVADAIDLVGNELKIYSGALIPYHKYTILARLKLNDGGYTAYSKVGDYICGKNDIITIDEDHNYLNNYNYTQQIQTKGATVFSTTEMYTKDILTVKHNDNSIYRQVLCDGKLKDLGPVLTLDNLKSMMDKPYVNIVPLTNGKVLVDYNAIRKVDIYSDYVPEIVRNNMLSNNLDVYEYEDLIIVNNHDGDEHIDVLVHRPRFELYDYNPLTHRLELVNSIIRDDELYGTAPTNSLVQMSTNEVYYIPALATTSVDSQELTVLKMKKLDLSTMIISDVIATPIVLKAYPTLFKMRGELYLTSGSNVETTSYYDRSWTRSNNKIYKYNTANRNWAIAGELNASIPASMFALASYTRKDGRVVLFNNVFNGSALGDQRTMVLDYDFTTTIHSNDTIDNMIYRNAIQLQNGDFIRISSRTEDPQLVYTYISDTMEADSLTQNDTVDIILDLVVPRGTTIQVEDLYRYESIVIEGDDTESGELRWYDQEDGEEYIFHYDDLIVTREMSIEQDLYLGDIREYNTITVLENASIEFYNTIHVPADEVFEIDGPITVREITVGENGELIVNGETTVES